MRRKRKILLNFGEQKNYKSIEIDFSNQERKIEKLESEKSLVKTNVSRK